MKHLYDLHEKRFFRRTIACVIYYLLLMKRSGSYSVINLFVNRYSSGLFFSAPVSIHSCIENELLRHKLFPKIHMMVFKPFDHPSTRSVKVGAPDRNVQTGPNLPRTHTFILVLMLLLVLVSCLNPVYSIRVLCQPDLLRKQLFQEKSLLFLTFSVVLVANPKNK